MPKPDRIIRLRTVLHRTGLSRSTLYRKMLEGTFPATVENRHSQRRLALVRCQPVDCQP